MKWITATDITNWANTQQRQCAEVLPELMSRLIFATAHIINRIEFPSGDSVATGGWDGRLITPASSPFFPYGTSGWEMGVKKSAKSKADADYAARVADSQGLVHSDTTFVFVTPRSWPGRHKWQNSKQADAIWKDVKVVAADAIEQWLDSVPAVALWLARRIGKVVSGGICDIEDFWKEWSLSTNPRMTAELVLGGRSNELEVIHKWIAEKPDRLEVQGDSPDEAFAFLYASIAALPESEQTRMLSRCVKVESLADFRNCIQAFQNPLVIAAPSECVPAVGLAVNRGHHVFLSVDSKVIDITRILRLPRPKRGIVETQLQKTSLSNRNAIKIARDFGRSIPVLRRRLSVSGVVRRPKWAESALSSIMLPVLVAGSWSEDREGDIQVIESLSAMRYDAFAKVLRELLKLEDSPLHKVANVWMLKSPLDAWFLVSSLLTNDFLKLVHQAMKTVLTETDPKYDLPAEERWLAAMHGKTSIFSEFLRTGLVESLVLMAVYGNRAPAVASTESFAASIVKEILESADTVEKWTSLSDVTPLLAEAAPEAFLDVVENRIASNPSLFQQLLQDEGHTIFGECKHSGLLWALESIAWSSIYFARTVRILSELATIDEGGQWANRPANSLKDIFLPQYPQTHATPKGRLSAFEALISQNAALAWQVAKGYFDRGFVSESHQFRWRDTGGERRGLEPESPTSYGAYISGLLPKLTQLAGIRTNMIEALDDFTQLPNDVRKHVTSALLATDPATFSKKERNILLEKIREALNWINSYGSGDRRADVPDLTEALKRFEPEDVFERVGWLLTTPWPRLPQGDTRDFEAHDKAAALAQEQAAREVLDNVAMDQILDFAKTVEYIGVLGGALGRVVRSGDEDGNVLDALLARVRDIPGEISSYASSRIRAVGPDWVKQQIQRLRIQSGDNPEAFALLLLGLPEGAETWSAVTSYGKDVECAYWKRASGRSRKDRTGDTAAAVTKLLDIKRSGAALEIAGDPKVSIPSALLKRLLQEFLMLNRKENRLRQSGMMTFHLGHVFRQLHERNELSLEDIAKLEWPYASLFDDLKRYLSSPLAIHRLLQRDPSLFAHFVSLMYKRDDQVRGSDEVPADEQTQSIARNAHELIGSWHLLPGLNDDGMMDEDELVKWVEAARHKCMESKHVMGVDIEIGKMLAYAPRDSDGIWPHTAVRNLLEHLSNRTIDRHIAMGLYNKRGATVRSLGEGGRQERELAQNYKQMSDALKVKWPRSSALLRSMAESYEQEAKREDTDTELRDLRWN